MINKGLIYIPKGSYKGTGEAILFIRTKEQSICDKLIYIDDIDTAEEFASDEKYMPMKCLLSCYQACIPTLDIYFDLVER
jgi:hypothetical protein